MSSATSFFGRLPGARAALCTASCAAAASLAVSPAQCKSSKKEPVTPKTHAELALALSVRGRHVFLTGRVDEDSAKKVITMLMYLEQEAPGVPIRLHINSSGGKVQSGFAIHDVMQTISSPVHTVCLGRCASIAAVLLASGAEGHRTAAPHARIMIHQPTRSGSARANAREMQTRADNIEQNRVRLADVLAARMGRPRAEVEKLLEHDTYCDTEAAIEYGLIDRVYTHAELVPQPPPHAEASKVVSEVKAVELEVTAEVERPPDEQASHGQDASASGTTGSHAGPGL